MTTILKNVGFENEIKMFTRTELPATPLTLIYAFADCLRTNGPAWLKSDDAKAMVHTLNLYVHGPEYQLDGPAEQKRLENVFSR